MGSHAVVRGQTDQRGGGGHQGGGHHGLHHWSLGNRNNGGKGSHWSGEGSHNWRGEEGERSGNWDGLSDGINKSILVDVLGESLQRDWSQTTLSRDQISESSSEGSGNLGVSLSLVETMYGLVAGARERPSVAGCVVRSVEVGVTVGGVVVQRISFRFCQAERGDNENSDLKKNIDKILMLI